jgi:hypothetical protein
MVADALVEKQIEDGRQLIADLVDGGFPVGIAFWAKTRDEGPWHLYIGSRSIGTGGLGDAYRILYSCLERRPAINLNIAQVKLMPMTHPIAAQAKSIRSRWPDRAPILWGSVYDGSPLSSLSADDIYIYPDAGLMTLDQVLHRVAGLLNRKGVIPPSEITLTDGRKIHAVPTGLRSVPGGPIQVTLHDLASGRTTEIPAEEIATLA